MARRAILFVLGAAIGALPVVHCASLDGLAGMDAGGDAADAAADATPGSDGPITSADGTLPDASPPPSDAGVDARSDAAACQGRTNVGTTMVQVLDAGFCMDSTEVTLDEYAAFLNSNPPLPVNVECRWKTAYTLPAFAGNEAIGNVDWCDAYAYCQWAGKRLCGGRGGVVLDRTNAVTPVSEWHYACTHGGDPSFPYPYGAGPRPDICLYADSPDSGHARPVGANPLCSGPAGIFDVSGNVWEWEDACDRGATTDPGSVQCNLRGGGFLRTSDSWGSCVNVPSGWFRNSRTDDTGIRCCSDWR